MNTGEGGLCYLKSYWNDNKFNDDDTHEESVHFLKGHAQDFINIPCFMDNVSYYTWKKFFE